MSDLYEKKGWSDSEKLSLLNEVALFVSGAILTAVVIFAFPVAVRVVGDSIKWAVAHFPYGL